MLLYWKDKCERGVEGEEPAAGTQPWESTPCSSPAPNIPRTLQHQLLVRKIWCTHTASSSKCNAPAAWLSFLFSYQCLLYLIPSPSLPQDSNSVKISFSLPPGAQTSGKHCRLNYKEPSQTTHHVSPTFPDANLGRGTLLHELRSCLNTHKYYQPCFYLCLNIFCSVESPGEQAETDLP